MTSPAEHPTLPPTEELLNLYDTSARRGMGIAFKDITGDIHSHREDTILVCAGGLVAAKAIELGGIAALVPEEVQKAITNGRRILDAYYRRDDRATTDPNPDTPRVAELEVATLAGLRDIAAAKYPYALPVVSDAWRALVWYRDRQDPVARSVQ